MTLFTLQYKHYQFAPSLVPSLIAFILLPILISLGIWQLNRADQKRVIDQRIHNAEQRAPLDLNQYISKNSKRVTHAAYRKTAITGHYDNKTFLLDNRTFQGKAGFHVLTPYLFIDKHHKKQAVLVNRGWIPYQGSRTNIPDIQLKKTSPVILGRIKTLGKSIVLNNSQESSQFPRIIQSISMEKLSHILHYTLLPMVIELDESQENGFIRDWKPYYGSVDRHIAYAVQWFAMAAVLAILYIKTNTKKVPISITATRIPH